MNSAAATLVDEALPREAATPSPGAPGAAASEAAAPAASDLRAAIEQLGADASRVIEVESLRLRARIDRKLTRWAGLALLVLIGLAALGMAGVQLARGVAGALGALVGGPEWAGPLLAGLLLPASALLVLRVARARRAQKRVSRAQELSEREDAQ